MTEQSEEREKVSFVKGITGLLKNKYWVLMVVALFSMYFMMSCFFGSALYFTKYNMGNEDSMPWFPICFPCSDCNHVLYAASDEKVSKRNVFLLGMAISTIGFLMAGVSTDYVIICVSSVVKGIGFGCGGATMFGCLQDAITYGEWYNGYGPPVWEMQLPPSV